MAAKRNATRRSPGTANILVALLAFVTPPALAAELQSAEVYHEKYGVIAKTKTGPIDQSVVNKLVDWIDHRAN